MQGELTRLRAERAERGAVRRHLETQRAEREADRERTREQLAQQLRAAYFMGRNEPLKLLLNQRSPAEFSRNLAYYGYLGRLRADQISQINENIAKIEELTAGIAVEDAKLAQLEQQQEKLLQEQEGARRQRGQVLARVQQQSSGRQAELRRMRAQSQQLERIIEQGRRATRSLPYDPKAPFAQTRRQLSWPVAGKISVNFGATISGLGKSESIDIDTEYGAPVRAIHEGRVEFADWSSSYGHLVVLDHGNGYLSIYGHLGELHVTGGSSVASGASLGTAGDSGGRKTPGLFFQLRHEPRKGQDTVPLDPRPWFRTAAPPAR
ncbi:MAG TPA: peptidoglycan DD-metalloendopeptidase family protein [Steroidobacteraceae bacterium]|nr:peptidoglycan DD-metalloendopeptidase family protein [Steroidobacteraceae bacterium]